MLHEKSVEFIRAIALKHGATRVLLFGSAIEDTASINDIDIAVEGLGIFEHDAMWDELMWAEELNKKNVDLIRMEDGLPINVIIENRGIPIYVAQ